MRMQLILALTIAGACGANNADLSDGSSCGPGRWSRAATALCFSDGIRQVSIPAPAGERVAQVSGYKISILESGKALAGLDQEGVFSLAELGWSDDGRALFVSESEGGIVGTWMTVVYLVEGDGVARVTVGEEVREHFMQRYQCEVADDPESNEEPNIAAITWLDGSRRLLMVAEVPPHSSCAQMGWFMGYEIAVPSGDIVQTYETAELVKRWRPELGKRLLDSSQE